MDVLALLARRAGEVVPREELLRRVWPGDTAGDDALSRCVSELRRQLVQAGGDPQLKALIETVPKRGYRLNAAVAPLAVTSAAAAGTWRRWLPAGIGTAAVAALLWLAVTRPTGPDPARPPATAEPRSIAVLPFADMSEGQDQGFLADGIAEEILNRLAQSKDLRVIARTSSFTFRGEDANIQEIAAALGVSHVLEGSVRTSGSQVRVTAQLIDAGDNSHVWSSTYDRRLGEVLEVQDDIAAAVATALAITLSATGLDESAIGPEAYALFLQGRMHYNRRAPGDIERAVKYYRDALALEPDYARAWAALAGAYNLLSNPGGDDRDQVVKLQGEAARKAVELAPSFANAHVRLAQYSFNDHDPVRGREHLRIAQALDPDDSLVMGFASETVLQRGDVAAAVEIWRRLVERDPLSPTDRVNYGAFLMMAGDYEKAIVELRKALELNPDFHWNARLLLAGALVMVRRYTEADTEARQLPDGEPRDRGLALLYHAPGRGAEADAALARLVAQKAGSEDFFLASMYALRGKADEAFAALRAEFKAAAESPQHRDHLDAYLDYLRLEMRKSPYLIPLHADPRWAELMTPP